MKEDAEYAGAVLRLRKRNVRLQMQYYLIQD